jgi:hypothetical protein
VEKPAVNKILVILPAIHADLILDLKNAVKKIKIIQVVMLVR